MAAATRLFDGTENLGEVWLSGDAVYLEVHRCGSCGVVFAFDRKYSAARREDHASWYCPNGHSFCFNAESEKERLRRERNEAQRREQSTRELLEFEERSHAATRGHLTRTKRRVAHGVCPCCKRSFKQLERHMKSQHPTYVEKQAEAA